MPLPFGPHITYFGIADASNNVTDPLTDAQGNPITDAQGNPIYVQLTGSGFLIVVEAQPGTSGFKVATKTFLSIPGDPTTRPDLQIVADHDLGADPSAAICDVGPPPTPIGGVPGSTIDFGPSQDVANRLNDLGCRFVPHDSSGDACTNGPLGVPKYVASGTTEQFCSSPVVGREIAFPQGDTHVSVQVRDTAGNIGDRRTLVVRVP